MNPLYIQELLDRCIDFLDASNPALRACSLVNRSWVHPAQARIFSEIKLEDPRTSLESLHIRVSGLLSLMDGSQHLIRYISTLHMSNRAMPSPDHFVRICSFPFIRLSSLKIWHLDRLAPDSEVSVAIQRMLALPTLRSLHFACRFTDRKHFLGMWANCSSNITDLALSCRIEDDRAAPSGGPGPAAQRHIVLASFQANEIEDILWWLEDPHCPFNFTRLRALLGAGTEILQHGILAPVVKTVEVFDVTSKRSDLSAFTRLAVLQFRMPLWDPLSPLRALSTIRPAGRVHLRTLRLVLVISGWLDPAQVLSSLCSQLDRTLFALIGQFSSLTTIYINVVVPTPAVTQRAEQYFPSLDPQISISARTSGIRGMSCFKSSLISVRALVSEQCV
ncbi:hypothetical protein B0H17DRAFT_1139811 [Mycena rosella]|uniref:Uncharacterized protein n=1 Tax=Mycena rosella TaxID=1033263 RepID=A0AAD7D3F4_MYCRO|nr:hypothetical protein B0H17DRAFT_1139811 [Mycena rosella]